MEIFSSLREIDDFERVRWESEICRKVEVSDLREKYLNFGRVLVNTFERDRHDCFSVAVTTVAVHRSIAHSIVTRLGYGWL